MGHIEGHAREQRECQEDVWRLVHFVRYARGICSVAASRKLNPSSSSSLHPTTVCVRAGTRSRSAYAAELLKLTYPQLKQSLLSFETPPSERRNRLNASGLCVAVRPYSIFPVRSNAVVSQLLLANRWHSAPSDRDCHPHRCYPSFHHVRGDWRRAVNAATTERDVWRVQLSPTYLQTIIPGHSRHFPQVRHIGIHTEILGRDLGALVLV